MSATVHRQPIVVAGAALVAVAPAMSGFGQYGLVFVFCGLGFILGVIGLIEGGRHDERPGIFLLAGAVFMLLWCWFASFVLFSGDPAMDCNIAVEGASAVTGMSKSLVPPALVCFSDGLPVIATPIGTVLGCSAWAAPVVALLGASAWLAARGKGWK
jgi:hypothetical protein